jgi:hypothetical protein
LACVGARKDEADDGIATGIRCVDGRGRKEFDAREKSNIKEHAL